jgi:hypothetical protein
LRYICSQAATEGSSDLAGHARSVNTGVSAITCASTANTYPIKSIRKQAAFRHIPVTLESFGILIGTANDSLLYTVQINPTLSAPLTYSNVANSSIQEATGNGTITVTAAGTVIASDYLTNGIAINPDVFKENFYSYLGSTLDNVMDEMVLCVRPVSGSLTTLASMNYKEF